MQVKCPECEWLSKHADFGRTCALRGNTGQVDEELAVAYALLATEQGYVSDANIFKLKRSLQ